MLGNAFSRRYVPQGFANMIVIDRELKKENYYFNFVRQEFLTKSAASSWTCSCVNMPLTAVRWDAYG
jgi:hypothetical protein